MLNPGSKHNFHSQQEHGARLIVEPPPGKSPCIDGGGSVRLHNVQTAIRQLRNSVLTDKGSIRGRRIFKYCARDDKVIDKVTSVKGAVVIDIKNTRINTVSAASLWTKCQAETSC